VKPIILRSLFAALRLFWARRRWIYGIYMLMAIASIPARTGFRLNSPKCDTRWTVENIGLSLTKVPHIVLFGIFFLLTVIQFNEVDRRAILCSLLATVGLGLLVEIQEGATRTGNCRITDVLPDVLGALLVAALLFGFVLIRRRLAGPQRTRV
jgi:VanZ family protein